MARSMNRVSARPTAHSYIDAAEQQLALARAEKQGQESVVFAYRAALRAAGALIEDGMVGRKRRPQGSAWAKLRIVYPELSGWAELFEAHARLASRAGMGLEKDISEMEVERVYRDARALVDAARAQVERLPEVA
ncbi:MAG TPA: hypothetical protein H9867_08780 [Candidatus Corynebacterium gallistercoris]|uniref:SAV-6107-like HEPN domain-containing protein n=1 Tax=Candidatus Corynebacterium gallistercoris TaxID=2838530 RepID=A0A9D1URZ5_9CORY|nr:hypothetical protein [Candidatus Corynebacterium gallistercoris]